MTGSIKLSENQKENLVAIYIKYEDRNLTKSLKKEIEAEIASVIGAENVQLLDTPENGGILFDAFFPLEKVEK